MLLVPLSTVPYNATGTSQRLCLSSSTSQHLALQCYWYLSAPVPVKLYLTTVPYSATGTSQRLCLSSSTSQRPCLTMLLVPLNARALQCYWYLSAPVPVKLYLSAPVPYNATHTSQRLCLSSSTSQRPCLTMLLVPLSARALQCYWYLSVPVPVKLYLSAPVPYNATHTSQRLCLSS